MTTYRRFSCNDLLRFGSLTLPSKTTEHLMDFYLSHLAEWPGNCLAAVGPGGRINGYIFGTIEGINEECAGRWTEYSVPPRHPLDLAQNLSKLLENSCENRYNAYIMKILVYPDDFEAISELQQLGYKDFILHSIQTMELRKPLPILMKIVGKGTEKESIHVQADYNEL